MDDGQVVLPYSNLRFFLDRFTALGPSYGLNLEKDKTVILTSTSGISPTPLLSSSDQQADLIYSIQTYATNKQENLHGIDVLGYPI
eukprot:scaffold136786_cov30-Attheya_sp.AAC.1